MGIGDERTEYQDLERFFVPASDAQGHSIQRFVRIPPEMDRQADVIVQTHVFPYRTHGDLHRHGLLRHLRYLAAIEDDIPRHFLQIVDANSALVGDARRRQEAIEMFTDLEHLVQDCLVRGEVSQAKRLASTFRSNITALPETEWARRLRGEFQTRFAGLLGG